MAEPVFTPEMLEVARHAAALKKNKAKAHRGYYGEKDHAKKKKARRKTADASRKLMRHVNGRTQKR